MDDVLIGLDLGTTTVKAAAVDVRGGMIAAAGSPLAMCAAGDGSATQDADAVATAAVGVIRQVCEKLGGRRARAIGLSAAMHTMLPVDATGRAMTHATTWADTRARAAEADIRAADATRTLYRSTGCPVRWLYWPARLRWWAGHDASRFASAARWVSIKEYAIHQLTGRWAVDVGIASATGLLDLQNACWSSSALQAAGLGVGFAERLSPLVQGHEVVGGLTTSAAAATGLPAGLPVVAGSSDGALANIGAAGIGADQTVVTIGTSGAVRVLCGSPLMDDSERTWCYAATALRPVKGSPDLSSPALRPWLMGGAVNNGGLAPAWVCERFYGGIDQWDQLVAEAGEVASGAEGVIGRPHLTGERSPWWDPSMTAAFTGLTLRHERRHLARATLEGVAFALAEVWEALGGTEKLGDHAMLTGGVTRTPLWCGLLADVLGVTLSASDQGDASARGAAMLAAVGVAGLSIEDVNAWTRTKDTHASYRPSAENQPAYRAIRQRWRDAGALCVDRN